MQKLDRGVSLSMGFAVDPPGINNQTSTEYSFLKNCST